MVDDAEETVRPVPMARVKELLEREQEIRGELTYEQKLASEQAKHFARFDVPTAEKLFEDLAEIEKLADVHRWRIVDIAPSDPEDVRALFAKDRLGLEDGEIDRIIEIVAGYVE